MKISCWQIVYNWDVLIVFLTNICRLLCLIFFKERSSIRLQDFGHCPFWYGVSIIKKESDCMKRMQVCLYMNPVFLNRKWHPYFISASVTNFPAGGFESTKKRIPSDKQPYLKPVILVHNCTLSHWELIKFVSIF